ncbi:hypothetical protein WPS_22890 [Vulcanimicrobium alpinum]|uniref:Flp family type IVb pilin n=1 Tax=Vulcanimicrobium alpinum TaxID=3016050 RepID=A0AAN1XZ53_UNVUL|nr:hypothetical protein [Vulcanimicrobium alpinum]BDE07013.1 hypothetical protein WPS_22890 [Vulcanimicrobium alpinum]
MSGAVLAPILTVHAALRAALTDDDSGQGLAEYGLILGLVALLCITAVLFLSGQISGVMSYLGTSL